MTKFFRIGEYLYPQLYLLIIYCWLVKFLLSHSNKVLGINLYTVFKSFQQLKTINPHIPFPSANTLPEHVMMRKPHRGLPFCFCVRRVSSKKCTILFIRFYSIGNSKVSGTFQISFLIGLFVHWAVQTAPIS